MDKLGALGTKAERVSSLLRRARSYEGRLDIKGAIRCYQARQRISVLFHAGASRLRRGYLLYPLTFPHPQAAHNIEPGNADSLVGLAKTISDQGMRGCKSHFFPTIVSSRPEC